MAKIKKSKRSRVSNKQTRRRNKTKRRLPGLRWPIYAFAWFLVGFALWSIADMVQGLCWPTTWTVDRSLLIYERPAWLQPGTPGYEAGYRVIGWTKDDQPSQECLPALDEQGNELFYCQQPWLAKANLADTWRALTKRMNATNIRPRWPHDRILYQPSSHPKNRG